MFNITVAANITVAVGYHRARGLNLLSVFYGDYHYDSIRFYNIVMFVNRYQK